MKLRVLGIITLLIISLGLFKVNVLASGFFLKSIGNVDTGGQQLSHWWYTSTVPVFHGEATPGAEVVVTIDDKSESINADSSGNWDYTGRDLAAGDHQVTFAGDGSTVKFTLTLGNENVDWNAVGSGSASTLPTAGNPIPTIILVTVGLGMGVLGGKMVFNVGKE